MARRSASSSRSDLPRSLSRSFREAALIPIIVLSGTTDPQMPAKVKALGADAFLSKPVDAAALFAALAKIRVQT
jgi:FixJ family two-component response regulator